MIRGLHWKDIFFLCPVSVFMKYNAHLFNFSASCYFYGPVPKSYKRNPSNEAPLSVRLSITKLYLMNRDSFSALSSTRIWSVFFFICHAMLLYSFSLSRFCCIEIKTGVLSTLYLENKHCLHLNAFLQFVNKWTLIFIKSSLILILCPARVVQKLQSTDI